MKQISIILFCVIISFNGGCKREPADAQANPKAVSVTPENKVQVNPVSIPAKEENTSPTIRIEWMTDYLAAQKKAADEGKDLFLNFTGSDWCVWCQRLDKEVFQQNIFAYMAQQHFVFVKLDFPRTMTQSKELKEQNEKLSQRYEVTGFPTIILAEANGRAYAQTGYLRGGPLIYLEELAKLQMQKEKQ